MAAFGILPGALQELHLIGNELGHIALGTVLSLITAVLNGTVYAYLAALMQVFSTVVRQTAPAHDVEKVCRAFALLVGKAALNSDGKCANRDAAVGHAQVGITGQVSDQSSSVHFFIYISLCYASLRMTRNRMTSSLILKLRSSSFGKLDSLSKCIRM